MSWSRCCSTLTFKPILVGPHSTACGEKNCGNKRVKMATVKVRTKEETPVPPQQCAGGIGPLCMILCAASFTSNCWKHITLYAIQCGVEELPKARWTRGLSAVSKVTSSTNKLSLQSCQLVQKQLANFCQVVSCHQAIAIGFLKRQHLNWALSNIINKFFIKQSSESLRYCTWKKKHFFVSSWIKKCIKFLV